MKAVVKTSVAIFLSFMIFVNCAPNKMDADSSMAEGSVVETSSGDIVTLPLEAAQLEKAPSNNLPLELNDLPAELITLLTPPSEPALNPSSGFLGNLFGGGGLFGGSGSTTSSTCTGNNNGNGIFNSILGLGTQFMAGSNPLLSLIIPKLASSLLKCGSQSNLNTLIPVGASGNQQIFALLAQILQANNQGKDPFALINGIKNPHDLSSIISIVSSLSSQSGGHAELQNLLNGLLNFQNQFGSAIGQCGNMNAKACKVFQIVNQLRSKHGLKALLPNVGCTLAAQAHSKDMFENSMITHLSSNGMSSKMRFQKFGLSSAVENIVKGNQLSAQQAVEMWMNSQSHRKNILSDAFSGGGVGFINGYFTQCFTK